MVVPVKDVIDYNVKVPVNADEIVGSVDELVAKLKETGAA